MSLMNERTFLVNLLLVILLFIILGMGVGVLVVPAETVEKELGALVTTETPLLLYIAGILRYGAVAGFVGAVSYTALKIVKKDNK